MRYETRQIRSRAYPYRPDVSLETGAAQHGLEPCPNPAALAIHSRSSLEQRSAMRLNVQPPQTSSQRHQQELTRFARREASLRQERPKIQLLRPRLASTANRRGSR